MGVFDRFLPKKSSHHKLWHQHKAYLDEQSREHPLKYLFLEITRRCNLACAHCGSGCTGAVPPAEMPPSEWIEAIRQVAADFDPKKIMIAVTGGEPTLKEGFLDIIRELNRLGFPYGMVTNGQSMTPALARDIVAAGMGSISLSFDAPPEINDGLRGRGSSAHVMSAIKDLQEAGFRGKLEVISTVTSPAIPRLDEMRKLVASMRVPLWRVAPVMPIGRAAERKDLVPSAREVRGILEYVRASREDKLLPRPEFSEEGFVGYRFEGLVRPYLCQCRAGTNVAGIRWDGRIGACPELSDAFDQGDIHKDRLRDVWNDGYKAMRDRSWARRGPCAECDHWDVCRGGALHLYEKPGGDFLRCLYIQAKQFDPA